MCFAYFGSAEWSFAEGEFAGMLSGFIGWLLTQPRKMSWISFRLAVVFIEPAEACERETWKPALSRAELYVIVVISKACHYFKSKHSRAVIQRGTDTMEYTCNFTWCEVERCVEFLE